MIEIVSRWDKKVLYRAETAQDIRAAVVEARREGANLRGADLRDADLRDANLRGANLRGAYLRSANLRDANLRGANLGYADLGGVYLRGADLRGADLWGADLGGVYLRGADLRGAYLRVANLRGADLRGADYLRDEADAPVSYPPNIARTRNARANVAARLAGEAQNRLRHAATILRTAPSGFPIGDPEAERVAAELSAAAANLDPLLRRTTNLRMED